MNTCRLCLKGIHPPSGCTCPCSVCARRSGRTERKVAPNRQFKTPKPPFIEEQEWRVLAAPQRPSPKPCSVAGCDLPLKAKGLCQKHYGQQFKEWVRATKEVADQAPPSTERRYEYLDLVKKFLQDNGRWGNDRLAAEFLLTHMPTPSSTVAPQVVGPFDPQDKCPKVAA